MKFHAGILDGHPRWDRSEVSILALTPGIPLEWIYAALSLGWRRRSVLRDMRIMHGEGELALLSNENAESIEPGDGWKMLEAVAPGYSGPVPLWSQLELKYDKRPNAAIGAQLGVHRETVRRWRTTVIFDPLSCRRVRLGRGGLCQ